MDRYLIETPHTEQNCRDLVSLVNAAGYLNHFDWGCLGGVHCGWAIIEAENESQARLAVPPLVRSRARVVMIVKFTCSILYSTQRDGSSADSATETSGCPGILHPITSPRENNSC